jgi:hypothetical protein
MSTLQQDQPQAVSTTSEPVPQPLGDPRFVRRVIGTGVLVWIAIFVSIISWLA